MFTKAKIYSLSLSASLLAKVVVEVESDPSNEVKNLNLHYDIALASTLQDLDLDSLSEPQPLELITELDDSYPWKYVYKYPSNCAFFRRIDSGQVIDNQETHIPKRVGMYQGQKAIFTNQYQAIAEILPKDIPLNALSPNAGMALAYKLAILSAPLNVGKGAKALIETIKMDYLISKAEAQETDRMENFNFESDALRSEWVQARMS